MSDQRPHKSLTAPIVRKYHLTMDNFDDVMNAVVEQLKAHDTVIVEMRLRHMDGDVNIEVLRELEKQRSIYEVEYRMLLNWYAERKGIESLYEI